MATLPLYDITIGVSIHAVKTLAHILQMAQAHPEAATFPSTRLAPDMLPFSFQVQSVSNFAKKAVERLAGRTVDMWEDKEETMEQLVARVDKTLALLETVKREDVESKDQTLTLGPLGKVPCSGEQYVLCYMIPNLFFHLTTAYDILRWKGVDVGKKDFLKEFFYFLTPAPQQA